MTITAHDLPQKHRQCQRRRVLAFPVLRQLRLKGKRHTPEQIASILKRQEGGLKVAEICRQEGISEQTFYRWKSKYGGMDSGDVRRLKVLEEENRRLKHLIGEKELDIQALKTIVEGKY